MKKAVMIVLMALLLVIPAYAAEGNAATDQPIQQEQEPVVVATLDELQAAIDAAEDGDTITIGYKILIRNMTVSTDKHIILTRNPDYTSGELIALQDNGIIDGFEFQVIESSAYTINVLSKVKDSAKILNCTFIGDEGTKNSYIYLNSLSKPYISNCTFRNCCSVSISAGNSADFTLENCKFIENYNDCINTYAGKIFIKNCIFDRNTCTEGAISTQHGAITIENCHFLGNVLKDSGTYADFHFSGSTREILNITDSEATKAGYYNAITGEKLTLPFESGFDTGTTLTYLTDKEAAEIFGFEYEEEPETNPDKKDEDLSGENNTNNPTNDPQEPGDQTGGSGDTSDIEQPPKDDGREDNTEPSEPVEKPQEPGNQTGNDDTTGGEQPPQGPTQPPEGEGTDNPENPDSGDQHTPQPPQKPSDSNNSGDNDYTPPVDYRPSQRPIWPVVTVKPTEDNKPQDQPENNPAPAKPQLACNGAVIDTSRTVVLLGYGDGLLHEGDPLTRAQMATVIYRLLDDESIALYSNTQVAFTDVAADAWYAPYVRVIQAAGIVNGVGDGKYDPEGTVTWAQILAILSRFVEQKEYTLQHIQYSGWAQGAIETAVALGWIEDDANFIPDAVIGRGELAQLINDVLALYR